MVKPERFGHLYLVYDFTIPLTLSCGTNTITQKPHKNIFVATENL